MTDVKKLLELRKAQKSRKPHFLRQDYHKKKRLALVWRRPKGVDSKLRKHMHGHGFLPAVGYRSPAAVRGMHKSGLIPIIINNVSELSKADPKINGVIIASAVGKKKKIAFCRGSKCLLKWPRQYGTCGQHAGHNRLFNTGGFPGILPLFFLVSYF